MVVGVTPITQTVTVKTNNPYRYLLNPHLPPTLSLPLHASCFQTLSSPFDFLRYFIYFLNCLNVEKHKKCIVWKNYLNKEWNITSKPFVTVWFIHLFTYFYHTHTHTHTHTYIYIYIYIYIYNKFMRIAQRALILFSLTICSYRPLRLIIPLDSIHCPHNVDVCHSLLIGQLCITRFRNPYKNVTHLLHLHILFVWPGWFDRWEASNRTAVVLPDVAVLRMLLQGFSSKQPDAFLCNSI